MTERLKAVAALFATEGGSIPWDQLPWHELRFQHVEFIRQRLQAYPPIESPLLRFRTYAISGYCNPSLGVMPITSRAASQ